MEKSKLLLTVSIDNNNNENNLMVKKARFSKIIDESDTK